MRKILLAVLALVIWSSHMLAAAADDLSGSWSGPWYRGMTSGTMLLEIQSDGSGTIQFTNLDNFGEEPVPLFNVRQADRSLEFKASGAGPDVFMATVRLTGNANVLNGKGEYDGFPIKFKLKRR